MDPATIQGIISGVIANGLTTIVSYVGGKSQIALKQLFREDSALDKNLKKAIESVAIASELEDEQKAISLRTFLSSPDVEAIVRQIYANRLTTGEDCNHLESIQSEFLAGLSLHLGESSEKLKELANQIFDILLESCDGALTVAVENGCLFAHEAKSSLRQRMILDELAVVEKNLEFLTKKDKPNVQDILEFEKKYLKQVANRHGHIVPPYFNEVRKLPIDNMFVPPTFVPHRKRDDEKKNNLDMYSFLSRIYRVVILGNPGAGKSTFTQKLCHDLAVHYSKRIFAGRQISPILVVLRDYGISKKERKCSILQFIETMVNSKYQVNPPNGAFEYLLLNGRSMIIFDGLDELLDTSYRQEISGDIECFCTLYPSVPVLITSRVVGYEQAPLDKENFEIFHLAPFDDEQVKKYVTNWFAADINLTSKQQTQKTNAFIEESKIVSDLRSNPLMLALMCNIYRGEGYIPKNRPDVYEKCSVMLFEQWDKSRGIHVKLEIEAHIRPAMMYLAHWIYSDNKLQGGVTEKNLIKKATEYLCRRRFDDRNEAEKAAREFIEFCHGRAWVFTDTGTTKEGERLYQFTHPTFLEYFTAAYLVRTHATPDDLIAVLLPKIAKREWDVVSQLAFQIQNRNIEGAGDKLLTVLINQADETGSERDLNYLSFAVRSLKFIVPSQKVVRNITKYCFQYCMFWGLKQPEQDDGNEKIFYKVTGLIENLSAATKENLATIADSVENLVMERFNQFNELEAINALEFICGFNNPFSMDKTNDFWEKFVKHIFADYYSQINVLFPKNFGLCFDAFEAGKVTIGDLINWHGIKSIFYLRTYKFMPRFAMLPIAERIKFLVLNQVYGEAKNLVVISKELGQILLTHPHPWIIEKSSHESDQFLITYLVDDIKEFDEKIKLHKKQRFPRLASDAFFGIYAIFSVYLEYNQKFLADSKNFKKIVECFKSNRMKLPIFDFIQWIFIARFEDVETEKVQAEMERCGFTDEQQDFVWRWIRHEINLVK